MAHILADDVEAHLHIRLALDSNDEIEILAAVKAAKKFIPCSKYIDKKKDFRSRSIPLFF